jgi:hypothetical protein
MLAIYIDDAAPIEIAMNTFHLEPRLHPISLKTQGLLSRIG